MFETMKQYFRNPPGWSELYRFGNSNISRMTILVPIIGYMLIFNEQIIGHLELSTSFVWQGEMGSNYRLFFFYFGLSSIGFGSIAFQLLCPYLIRNFPKEIDYTRNEKDLITDHNVLWEWKLVQKLSLSISTTLFDKNGHLKQFLETVASNPPDRDKSENFDQNSIDTLRAHWLLRNVQGIKWRRLIHILYAIGFLLLSIPTADTFLRVVIAFFERLFA